MKSDKVFHVISNTHWDREWRFSFQRNRQMLVEMIDNVLDILCREPEYKAFHLDSQSIVLEDYLEIKPDKKELIVKLVKDKRLLIGPWYILPDEFQVGGENLIRNLLLGHKICREFGAVSKVGYSPFSWGQISQLPQIYNGFGIDVIMFYRGVNSLESSKAEFLWEGADGTTSLTSRFSTMPRYNFYFYIYRRIIHNEEFADVEFQWDKGLPFHISDTDVKEDYYNIKPGDSYYKENIKRSVESIIKDQADDFTTPHVIWMEGHDSSGPNIKTVNIIKDIKKEFPGLDVRHSTLEEYSALLKSSADYKNLSVVKGERRSSQFDRRSGNLYGYTTSARMDIKIKNFDAERWVQYYAEPFNSFAGILGTDINNEYLNKAWNFIIQNSAHDSIGGCSLDSIHEDMMYRYNQSIRISQGVFNNSLKEITKCISANSESGINIIIFNPLPFSRNEVKEIFIDIPVRKGQR
jgi:mannosylglycerate hydrolase